MTLKPGCFLNLYSLLNGVQIFEIPGAYTPAPCGMKRKARKEGVCYEQNNYSIRTD